MDSIKRAFAFAALVLGALVLLGCSSPPPKSAATDPVSYAIPVAAGCIGKDGRPDKPVALKDRYTAEQWAAMPPGAKAQAVAAQGGKRMNYEDGLGAATSGCR